MSAGGFSAPVLLAIGCTLLATVAVGVLLVQQWRSSAPRENVLVPPVPLLSVSTASWALLTAVLVVQPRHGGTVIVLALCLSSAVILVSSLSRARQLHLRVRHPVLRLGLDGLLIGVALTLSVWFVSLGPHLVTAGELRRVATAALLVISLSAAAGASLHVSLVPSRRSAVYAMLAGGQAAAALLMSYTWPAGPLRDGSALVIALGACLVIAARLVSLAVLVLGGGDATVDRVARRRRLDGRAGVDEAGLPTPRELNPSTMTSLFVTVVLIGTLLFYPVPPRQAVPMALVVLLMVVFAVREYLFATLREHLTGRLRRQALTDPLTRLTNRRGLSEWLAWQRDRDDWTVVAVDLDGFKQVNDLLGYEVADSLLAAAGAQLRELPAPALACSLGGDEFVVMTPGGLERGLELGRRLHDRLGDTLPAVTFGVPVTASIGVGRMCDAGDDAAARDPLVALAESSAALRAAKAASGDQVVAYAGDVARAKQREQRIESRLRSMVGRRGVDLAALPVVDLGTGRIEGVEALARWEDRLLGAVTPAEFVPVAEQHQLMQPLGHNILLRALDEAAGLRRAAGLPRSASDDGLSLSVNLSLAQLRRADFVDVVEEALTQSGFPASRLIVDVPESTVLSEDGAVSQTLILLHELGVRIAIDDFGTGHLALSCLQWLPVDQLKVDRRLTETPDDPRTRAVVETVIDIAHEVDLRVVMEGISTPELARYWHEAGADAGQGYALVPPSSWGEVGALVRDGVRLGGTGSS